MTTQPQPISTEPSADPYLDLVRACPLRPIRSSPDHDRAIAMLDALSDRRPTLQPAEVDYLTVLALLVERYEATIYPEPIETS